ncbi:MAG: hypothetical protein ACLQGU_22345 [bacterium]
MERNLHKKGRAISDLPLEAGPDFFETIPLNRTELSEERSL